MHFKYSSRQWRGEAEARSAFKKDNRSTVKARGGKEPWSRAIDPSIARVVALSDNVFFARKMRTLRLLTFSYLPTHLFRHAWLLFAMIMRSSAWPLIAA